VTEVVTQTVDHLDDGYHGDRCHDDGCLDNQDVADHVTLTPELDDSYYDNDDTPKPDVVRKPEVSWRPHQQYVTTLPRRGDVIKRNKMAPATTNYTRSPTVLTAL